MKNIFKLYSIHPKCQKIAKTKEPVLKETQQKTNVTALASCYPRSLCEIWFPFIKQWNKDISGNHLFLLIRPFFFVFSLLGTVFIFHGFLCSLFYFVKKIQELKIQRSEKEIEVQFFVGNSLSNSESLVYLSIRSAFDGLFSSPESATIVVVVGRQTN